MLGHARAIRIEKLPSGKAIRCLAARMDDLADAIEVFETSQFIIALEIVDEEEKPGIQDLPLWDRRAPRVYPPKHLRARSEQYKHWCLISKMRISPRRDL